MLIAGIQQYTMVDYPWKLACVLFTPWCNRRCPFCHNPEMVLPERIKELRAHIIPEEALFRFLSARRGRLQAVSICGGEPTLQSDLVSFAKRVKAEGFLVKLDTNGRDVHVVEELLREGAVDYIAVDMKHSPERMHSAVGRNVDERFRENYTRVLSLLKDGSIEYEYRTTVIEGMHTAEDIERIGSFLQWITTYYLQRFVAGTTLDPAFPWTPLSREKLQIFQKIAGKYVKECKIRGW